MTGQKNTQGIEHHTFIQSTENWGLRIFLSFLAVLWLGLVAGTWANASDFEGEAPAPSPSHSAEGKDEEYNFNWLDPEKKIYVLQNRRYLKASHPQLSMMAGTGFSNPYRVTYNLDARVDYYLSELWGLELFYTLSSNAANSTLQALSIAAPSTLPQIREIRAQYGAMVQFVPWYAKINVFNKILYFDWYFGAGIGSIQSYVNTQRVAAAEPTYVSQDLTGIFLSTGHLYHLSESFLVRLDMTGAIYNAPVNGTTGDAALYSNFNFGLGIGLKI